LELFSVSAQSVASPRNQIKNAADPTKGRRRFAARAAAGRAEAARMEAV
jgi:hypothetical protein